MKAKKVMSLALAASMMMSMGIAVNASESGEVPTIDQITV